MTPEQLTILAAELAEPGYAGMSYEQIVASLNYQALTTEQNPEPQGQVYDRVDIVEVLGVLALHDQPGLVTTVEKIGFLIPDLKVVLQSGDRAGIEAYFALFVAGGYFSETAAAALQQIVYRQIPDPNYSPVVTVALPSRATQLGLPYVTLLHIQAASQ
jgi:hypothetical protein